MVFLKILTWIYFHAMPLMGMIDPQRRPGSLEKTNEPFHKLLVCNVAEHKATEHCRQDDTRRELELSAKPTCFEPTLNIVCVERFLSYAQRQTRTDRIR
mmetsp:Transcript_17764/g.48330  ORF Transcript_17764/g.48330 Transcript_17764/m.48330 type:complete len:99 (+) Transcript_17764:1188-1484(+)